MGAGDRDRVGTHWMQCIRHYWHPDAEEYVVVKCLDMQIPYGEYSLFDPAAQLYTVILLCCCALYCPVQLIDCVHGHQLRLT